MAKRDWSQYETPVQKRDWSKYENYSMPQQEEQQNPLASGAHNFFEVTSALPNALFKSGIFGETVARGAERFGQSGEHYARQGREQNPNSAAAGEFLGYTLPAAAASYFGVPPALGVLGNLATKAAHVPGRVLNPITNKMGISSEAIGKKIASGANKAIEKSSLNYNKLFEDAMNAGVKEVKVPLGKMKDLIKSKNEDYYPKLSEYLKDPTLEKAHKAQSALGKFIRSKDKMTGTELREKTKAQLVQARKFQNNIEQEMHNALKKADPKLSKELTRVSKEYKEEVVPHKLGGHLKKYEAGNISAKDLAQAMRGNKEFMNKLGSNYPEYKANQYLPESWFSLLANVFSKAKQ